MYPVEIRKMPSLTLHGLPHRGFYGGIGPTFRILGQRLQDAGLTERTLFWAGVYHDDPARVPPNRLRSHACCRLEPGLAPPPGFETLRLRGGRAAVVTYRGPYAGLAAAWAWVHAEWLPAHGERARKTPYEVYRTMFPAVPAAEQVTEIVVPLV